MPVEVRPLAELCNLGCTYCYQESIRKAKNISTKYDVDKIIERLEEVNQKFHLFGGEAFLVPREDRVKLWEYGYEKFKENGVQTNGTLIEESDIMDLLKYNVNVGISIDGPNELNDLREVRTGKKGSPERLEATRKATQKTLDNIRMLTRHKVNVGIIITLHKVNASKENLPRMLQFIDWLDEIGVRHGNIHTLEVEATMPDQEKHVLTQKENIEAFMTIAKFLEDRPHLQYQPFHDMKKLLLGDDTYSNCTWNFCDYMNTQAVYGVDGDGSISNCGRTNKEGVKYHKAEDTGFLRYISLYNTPQELNGCKDCRFWSICSGNCPGESVDGDFRNKSIHCSTYKSLLGYYEQKLIEEGEQPITKSPILGQVELKILEHLARGQHVYLKTIYKDLQENPIKITIPVKGVTDNETA